MTAPNTIPRATLQQALQLLLGDLAGEDYHLLHVSPSQIITFHDEPGLPSVRQWLIVDECPSCHTPDGRPHTEYCQPAAADDECDCRPPYADCPHPPAGPIDLVAHLRGAVNAARTRVRAHERDHDVEDSKGTTWHQTGPDDAHERWRCDPTTCGWASTIHQCTDPACPVHGPHAHAGTDILMRHPDCACQFLQAWRTWSLEHRDGCPCKGTDQ